MIGFQPLSSLTLSIISVFCMDQNNGLHDSFLDISELLIHLLSESIVYFLHIIPEEIAWQLFGQFYALISKYHQMHHIN